MSKKRKTPKPVKPIVKPTYRQMEEQMEALRQENERLVEGRREAEKRMLELERMLLQMGYKQPTPEQMRQALEGLPLFDGQKEDPDAPAAEASSEEDDEESDKQTITYTRRNKKAGTQGRKGLPEHLEREQKRYAVDASQLPGYDPKHGHHIIDYDKSEELLFVPARFKVRVHLRPVVAYTTLAGLTCVATVGGPQKVFAKCMASPEVLAKIAVDRLDASLTLYRIERWFKDNGCRLSRGTLCTWMMRLGQLLEPVARAQMRKILNGFKIHVDDTNISIQDKGAGQVKAEKIWVFIGGNPEAPQVVFNTTPRRTGAVVWDFFKGYGGYMQVDACGVYDDFFENSAAIEVGCWSHVFRRFDELKEIDRRVQPMRRMIRQLCDLEEMAKEWDHRHRYIFRALAAKPILSKIRLWVEEQRSREVLESRFKKALNYVHNQWPNLTRYLEDGRLSMDNNVSESEFHVVGVTRRNHLFWGADGIAPGLVLMGLIRTCRKNGINPYEYLCDIIHKVAETETPAHELIPTRWKALRKSARRPDKPSRKTASV